MLNIGTPYIFLRYRFVGSLVPGCLDDFLFISYWVFYRDPITHDAGAPKFRKSNSHYIPYILLIFGFGRLFFFFFLIIFSNIKT
jgi:hypothetical protein